MLQSPRKMSSGDCQCCMANICAIGNLTAFAILQVDGKFSDSVEGRRERGRMPVDLEGLRGKGVPDLV